MRRKIWTLLIVAVFLAPQSTWKTTSTWKQDDLLAFQPLVELMQSIASAEEVGRETAATAIAGLMQRLASFLRDQGIPEDVLEQVMKGFTEARDGFLEGELSASEFGGRVAALARELRTRAEERGVQGVPQELLQEIGLDPGAIDALRSGDELAPEEIVALAEEIGGAEEEVPPDEAAPPDGEPPPDEGSPPDEAAPPEGEGPPPEDDMPPPDDAGSSMDEPPPDDEPLPDEPPPDDLGPPPDDVPPEDPGP